MESEEAKEPSERKYPFCTSLMQGSAKTSCTADFTAVGSCNLVKYRTDLPEMYQNFKEVEGVNERDIKRVRFHESLAIYKEQ